MSVRGWGVVLTIGCAACLDARGQQAPDPRPSHDPALHQPGTDQKLLDQQKRTLDETPVAPVPAKPGQYTPPSVPRVEVAGVDFAKKRAIAEGTFVVRRPGRLIRSGAGDSVFVPTSIGEGDPPMILQPCRMLSVVRAAVEVSPEAIVTISGQVTVYRGRHYLLPTAFELGVPAPIPGPAPSPSEQPDPTVDELIRGLESDPASPRGIPMEPPMSAEPSSTTQATLPEGTLITNRRARLVRSARQEGRLAAMFDNDPDSPGEPPMILLPCRALESLEGVAAWRGENTPFRLSGRVFAFEGRNYCLPTLVRVIRPGDIAPRQ